MKEWGDAGSARPKANNLNDYNSFFLSVPRYRDILSCSEVRRQARSRVTVSKKLRQTGGRATVY
ncbi:unnamed protein product [Ectocarpus sp. 8 AP-2014]